MRSRFAVFALMLTGAILACRPGSGSRDSNVLSGESLAAVQALRLLGAVQITHFTTARGYVSPADLKKAGVLDPEWPRVDTAAYRIACEVPPSKESFICFADALRAGQPWFRIDDSQKLRTETARRPTGDSPLLGPVRTGGNP